MSEDTIVVGNLRIPEQHFVNMIFDEDSENIEKREGLINRSHLIIYTKTIVEWTLLEETTQRSQVDVFDNVFLAILPLYH